MTLKPMDETVRYKYTPEFARKVFRQMLLRRMGLPFVLMVFGLIYLLWAFDANKGFLWGVTSASIAICIILAITNESTAATQAELLSNSVITVSFNEDGITFDSTDQISIVKWRRFSSITILNDAWLFWVYGDNRYTAIPSAILSNSIKTLIEKKLAENHKLTK